MTIWSSIDQRKGRSVWIKLGAALLSIVLLGCTSSSSFSELPAVNSFCDEIGQSYEFVDSCAIRFSKDRFEISFIVEPTTWEDEIQENEAEVENILEKTEEFLESEPFRAESEKYFEDQKMAVSFEDLKVTASFATKGRQIGPDEADLYSATSLFVYSKASIVEEWKKVYPK